MQKLAMLKIFAFNVILLMKSEKNTYTNNKIILLGFFYVYILNKFKKDFFDPNFFNQINNVVTDGIKNIE